MSDLVEQLRSGAKTTETIMLAGKAHDPRMLEAADRIEELEAEVGRYLGELRKIVNGQGKMIWDEDREARAALRETDQ